MDYYQQLRGLALRLSQVNQALQVWDEIDAQVAAPTAAHRAIAAPALDRRALKTELIMLLADMSRLEQEISAHSAFSLN